MGFSLLISCSLLVGSVVLIAVGLFSCKKRNTSDQRKEEKHSSKQVEVPSASHFKVTTSVSIPKELSDDTQLFGLSESALQDFDKLLAKHRFELIMATIRVSEDPSFFETLANDVVSVFESHSQTCHLIKKLIKEQTKQSGTGEKLLDSKSLICHIMRCYALRVGRKYAVQTLANDISFVVNHPGECGVTLIQDEEDEETTISINQEQLKETCKKFFDTIVNSLEHTPLEFFTICGQLQKSLSGKNPQLAIGEFIFNNYFCQLLLHAQLYDLVREQPSKHAQQVLEMVASALEQLGRNTVVESSGNMAFLGEFITENYPSCKEFCDKLASAPKTAKPVIVQVATDSKEQDLENLYKYIKHLLPVLKQEYHNEEFYKEFERQIHQ